MLRAEMKRKRYTEEQIISILKEHESGGRVPDLARRHYPRSDANYASVALHSLNVICLKI